jgi:hypothetical protein
MPYVEIKSRDYIDSTLARKLVEKGVTGVITTGKISGPAKELLDKHDIVWKEYVSEKSFKETEVPEL